MPEPASQQDLIRLTRNVEALEATVKNALNQLTNHLKLIHDDVIDVSAALVAIGDERVQGEADYNQELVKKVELLREDVRASYQYIRHCLEEVDVDNQIIKRSLEETKLKKTK
jgi:archaellum component FlaC